MSLFITNQIVAFTLIFAFVHTLVVVTFTVVVPFKFLLNCNAGIASDAIIRECVEFCLFKGKQHTHSHCLKCLKNDVLFARMRPV